MDLEWLTYSQSVLLFRYTVHEHIGQSIAEFHIQILTLLGRGFIYVEAIRCSWASHVRCFLPDFVALVPRLYCHSQAIPSHTRIPNCRYIPIFVIQRHNAEKRHETKNQETKQKQKTVSSPPHYTHIDPYAIPLPKCQQVRV